MELEEAVIGDWESREVELVEGEFGSAKGAKARVEVVIEAEKMEAAAGVGLETAKAEGWREGALLEAGGGVEGEAEEGKEGCKWKNWAFKSRARGRTGGRVG